ncbi:hypothetical protein [Acidianus sp. HS-5]|uniref:hypothetical protein n=1 Tax=Acidianus sp. HS-5 TaxID=2886040 RepID=UPI001F43FAC0|nr:hypothetical protein [Acidianus sp. HS-5]BDC17402.1 hypothetical protein HS5_02920 [Acidianus sp. HS-5]
MDCKKPIGGYFEFELDYKQEYYPDLIKLNNGRNCVKYIIKAQQVKEIYIPYFTDKSLTEKSIRDMTKLNFYHIDKNLETKDEINTSTSTKVLYINYFTLKGKYIRNILVGKYGDRLIIDNTQAFFSRPIEGIDTLYSLGGKYFGVPDGGLLYTTKHLDEDFEQNYTYDKSLYLLGRLDYSPEPFYEILLKEREKKYNQPIRRMSKLTETILRSINYEKVKLIRERNFYYLHNYLRGYNMLTPLIDEDIVNGPYVYPLLIENGDELKKYLISNRIYVATYWPVVLEKEYWKNELNVEGPSDWEIFLAKNLVPLPIDQRYDLSDMDYVLQHVMKVLRK